MRFLKSYNESFPKLDTMKEIGDAIIQFLISREQQYTKMGDYRLMFDTYQLVSDGGGTHIKAITRVDSRGNRPDVPFVMYDFNMFLDWLSNLRADDPLKIRSRLMNAVISHLESVQEPDEIVCGVLDGLLSCQDSWSRAVETCRRLGGIFSKYDLDEIDLRSTEYFDDLLYWTPKLGFWTTYNDNFCFGIIHLNPVFLIKYVVQTYPRNDFGEFLQNMKSVIRISFNMTDVNDEKYSLSHCRDVIYERLYSRLKRLYPGIQGRFDGYGSYYEVAVRGPAYLVNKYDIGIFIS